MKPEDSSMTANNKKNWIVQAKKSAGRRTKMPEVMELPNISMKTQQYLGKPLKRRKVKGPDVIEDFKSYKYDMQIPSGWSVCHPPKKVENNGWVVARSNDGVHEVRVLEGGALPMTEIYSDWA
jgi:hypothetical protein